MCAQQEFNLPRPLSAHVSLVRPHRPVITAACFSPSPPVLYGGVESLPESPGSQKRTISGWENARASAIRSHDIPRDLNLALIYGDISFNYKVKQ